MSDIKPVPANLNKAMIAGRIDNVRQFDGKDGSVTFETRIVQAAADEFSSPSFVGVLSRRRLGAKGEDVKILVDVAGYKDSYPDKKTGEVVQTARNSLRAVE